MEFKPGMSTRESERDRSHYKARPIREDESIVIESARRSTIVPCIHIVGRKNSGKTTLIVELVQHLTGRGLRVGTIKHTHHHHELDTPGKDSHRHREAGAAVVGIVTPGVNAVFLPREPETRDADCYRQILPLFEGCDLLLVEGHPAAIGKKIEVWRAENLDSPIALGNDSILAVVTDDPLSISVPIWSRRDIGALAQRLVAMATAH